MDYNANNMNMDRGIIPFLITAFFLIYSYPEACLSTMIDLHPIISATIQDGPRADGVFDSVTNAPSDVYVLGGYTGPSNAQFEQTNRAIYEFDLRGISNTLHIDSVRFIFTRGSASNPGNLFIQGHGYIGNGVAEIADALINNLLDTIHLNSSGAGPFPYRNTLNVTSFTQGLHANGTDYAGFMFRTPNEGSSFEEQGVFMRASFLRLSTSPVPMPEPSSFLLFGLGLILMGKLVIGKNTEWGKGRG